MASWFIWGPFRECARALSNTTNPFGTSSGSFISSTSLTMGNSFWHRIFSTSGARTSFPLRLGEQQSTTSRQLRSQTLWAPGSPYSSTGNKAHSRDVSSANTPAHAMSNASSPPHARYVLRTVRTSLSLCCSSWSSRDSLVSGGTAPGYALSGDVFSTLSLVLGFPAPVYTSSAPSPTAPLLPASASSPTLSSSTTSRTTSRTEAPLASSRQRGYAPDGDEGSSDVVPSRGLRCFIPQTLLYRVSF